MSVVHRFTHTAMTTTIEILVAGVEQEYARQAAGAVFAEIDRVASLLNLYDPCSDIARINRLRPGKSVRVSVETFQCLQLARSFAHSTNGVFDVSVGPLVHLWHQAQIAQITPAPQEIHEAQQHAGFEVLQFEGETVGQYAIALSETASANGVMLDLGGIGKGFVLDCALEILTDWKIDNALLHTGTSTAYAIGTAGQNAECQGWHIGVGGDWGDLIGFRRIALSEQALSGSGMEVKGSHIIHPITGVPVTDVLSAWALGPSAAEADACSTAVMLMSAQQCSTWFNQHPEFVGLVIEKKAGKPQARLYGDWKSKVC